MTNSNNGFSVLAECQECGKKFEMSSTNEVVQHKKEFKVNEQSIFVTYYDCPDCGRRHYIKIDNQSTLNELKDVERQFVKLAAAKTKGKTVPQKQSAKFKKSREHLAHSRNELMKQYTGKLIHDSDTDSEFELRFSV